MSKTNIQLIPEYTEEVHNQKHIDRIFEYCSKDCIIHIAPYVGLGLNADERSGERVILVDIAPTGPAHGKLLPGDELVRVQDDEKTWETFNDLKSGLWGQGVFGTHLTATVREKQLYPRLSVFVGGFTLETAETVCNAENKFDILEGLTALVDNSLLRKEETTDYEPRFSMLEIIRAFAVERLAESGETPALQANHAQYFGNIILNQSGLEIYSPKSQQWLTWFELELDNIRAALHWSLATPQGIQIGVGLIFMLFWFWYRRGYFTEGQQWAEKFLAVPDVQNIPPLRAMALASSGMMALWQGQQETALVKLQENLAIEQQLEDDRMVATSQMANGIAFINMCRDGDAQPLLQQAGQFFQQAGMDYFHALTLVHLGNAELGLGDMEQARAYHEDALGKARAINENWLIAFALNNLGEVARTQGQFDKARKYYEECEALLPDSGDKGDRARFVHSLGYIAQHEGNYERAESQFRTSQTMFRRLGNRRGMAECMAGLAGLKAREGRAEWGAVLLRALNDRSMEEAPDIG